MSDSSLTHMRNRSRPLTYDDSCWGCVLDDHLYEGEDDELARMIGEEPIEDGLGLMTFFMLYAVPTVSEEEDPKTMRVPSAVSSQESHKGLGEQTYQKNVITYEIPPLMWLHVPEAENGDSDTLKSNEKDRYQPCLETTSSPQQRDLIRDESDAKELCNEDPSLKDRSRMVPEVSTIHSKKNPRIAASSSNIFDGALSEAHYGDEDEEFTHHRGRAIPTRISIYSDKAHSISAPSKVTDSTKSMASGFSFEDDERLLRKGITMLRERSLACLARGLRNAHGSTEDFHHHHIHSTKSKTISTGARGRTRSSRRSRSAALARHRSKSRGRAERRDREESIHRAKSRTRRQSESADQSPIVKKSGSKHDAHRETTTHCHEEIQVRRSRSQGARSVRRPRKHNKLRLF